MTQPPNQRALEQDITTDLRDRLSYGGYLQLDTLLSAQTPLSNERQCAMQTTGAASSPRMSYRTSRPSMFTSMPVSYLRM